MARHSRRKSARRSKRNGGGYSFDPSRSIAPGYLETNQYDGIGKDCPGGSFVRPGFLSANSGTGVPGMQNGGRYESNPGALLDGGSDIGMKSYSGAGRIACEGGSANSLNMRGGAADSMFINSQNAGYGHRFETLPSGSAVGGLMINTPYEASKFNPACSKTGGKRSMRRKRSKRSTRKHSARKRSHRHKHSRRCKHSTRKHSGRKRSTRK
jgi:hypothetical protein